MDTDTAYVNVLTRGDLSSVHWIESPLKYFNPADHPNHQLCTVYYTALNFRDVMLATGKLPPDAIPGKSASCSTLLTGQNAIISIVTILHHQHVPCCFVFYYRTYDFVVLK